MGISKPRQLLGRLAALVPGLFMGALLDGSGLAGADNPIIQTIFSTDPAPMVYNDRLYVFTGHDEDGSNTYNMKDWHAYSTSDMANWQDHGVMASLATFSWANANAWAGQVIARNDKFYYYVPVRHNTGAMAIGVAVANSITGPYKDALGKPLVENNEIDPTVYIDDNGQAYLYWGNPNLFYLLLNQDMISYAGSVNRATLTPQTFGPRPNPTAERPSAFEEGPWFYKRNSTYYMVYAANCCSEDIRYSTGTSATGPWKYRGVVMASAGGSFTNHPGVVDFQGSSYFFYHNGALPGGNGYRRSVCVEKFSYESDGSIPTLKMTTAGPPQTGKLNPYTHQEAETMAFSAGLKTEAGGSGIVVTSVDNNDYIKVKGVDFGSGARSFSASVSSATAGGKIELHLGSMSGTTVGTCTVPGTGSWTSFTTVTCTVSGADGTQDLYMKFTGGSGQLFNFDHWQFSQ